MAYGKIKADALIRDNSGTDEEITMATIAGLDSSKAALASPTFTGTPAAPTAATSTNTTQIATTAYVKAQLADTALTGTPTAPTATANTNTTQVATTAYVQTELGDRAATGANTFSAAQAVTPSVQTSAGALDMDASNFIEVAGVSYNTTPTGLVVGTSGLFYADTAAPTNWHSTFKFVTGGYVAPTTFPAVAPWYVAETDEILVGAWTQGINVAGS